jgi:hypothetical protein
VEWFKSTLIFLIFTPVSSLFAQETTFVSIGTGGVTGVYYPTGGAIAQMINQKREKYHIRASVESTGGSVYNINAIMAEDLDFGIAQSDRQYQAWYGKAEWQQTGPQRELRAICSIHPEIVTIVANVNSGIESLKDLAGKRVNIGNPGSGHRGNAIDVLTTIGLDWQSDLKAQGLKAAEAPHMLQDSRIDAFFYTVGHPAGAITEATAGKRAVRFVPITGMDSLLEKCPYYAKAMIPIDLYPNVTNKEPVPSIGVMTTFVTAERVPSEIVYAITKELFDNLDTFKALHPAFRNLEPEGMLQGLTAPLHPGAERYFKESGLIKFYKPASP